MNIRKGTKFKVRTSSVDKHLKKGEVYIINLVDDDAFEFRCSIGPGHTGMLKGFKQGRYIVVHEELNKQTKTL